MISTSHNAEPVIRSQINKREEGLINEGKKSMRPMFQEVREQPITTATKCKFHQKLHRLNNDVFAHEDIKVLLSKCTTRNQQIKRPHDTVFFFLTFLMLWPFNPLLHVVVNPHHKLFYCCYFITAILLLF